MGWWVMLRAGSARRSGSREAAAAWAPRPRPRRSLSPEEAGAKRQGGAPFEGAAGAAGSRALL